MLRVCAPCFFAVTVALLAGCAGDDMAGPAADPASEAAAIVAAMEGAGAGGAWIIREGQECFLPGIDANGLPYPLSAPCSLQLVLTGNGNDVGAGTVKAQVPNASGRAVRLRYGPVSPFPCFFLFDSDGDGNIDLVKETTRYTMVVAGSGQLHMSCQFPGG